jgi:hypothetical protein
VNQVSGPVGFNVPEPGVWAKPLSQPCHRAVAALQLRPGTMAAMSQPLPTQHPAVVLRSHYRHLRAQLAIAMIAVVGLAGAVVILATDDDVTRARSASPVSEPIAAPDGPRYLHSPGQRYNGAREQGAGRQR